MTDMQRLRAYIAQLPPGYPITRSRMARALNLAGHVASTYLQRMAKAGELEVWASAPPHADGGRPATIYRPRPR